jgi:hypothetical protein
MVDYLTQVRNGKKLTQQMLFYFPFGKAKYFFVELKEYNFSKCPHFEIDTNFLHQRFCNKEDYFSS